MENFALVLTVCVAVNWSKKQFRKYFRVSPLPENSRLWEMTISLTVEFDCIIFMRGGSYHIVR